MTKSRKEIYEKQDNTIKQIFTALCSNVSGHHDSAECESDHGRRSRRSLYDGFTGGGRKTVVWTVEYQLYRKYEL